MNSTNSEDKSVSQTSDSEYKERQEKIRNFQYPIMPKRNAYINNSYQKRIKLATNLFELKFKDKYHNITLFQIKVEPSFDESDFTLRRLIYNYIEANFPGNFKKNFFGGNILYSLIYAENENEKNSLKEIKFKEKIKEKEYIITLAKIKEVEFKQVNDFSGQNQKIKHYIETLIRNIVMKNKNVIYFKDRTLFEINIDNVTKICPNSNENIYRGYMTSANITENGLFLLINNINKVISGKTVLQKINEIKERNKNLNINDIKYKISSYFENKTVITGYGVPRAYRISNINFDLTPTNKTITIREKENNCEKEKTVTLYNYYETKYARLIKEKNQPLIQAELKKRKKNPEHKNSSDEQQEDEIKIYLVPELLFLTGKEDDIDDQNKKGKEKKLINKTRMNPDKKMELINGFSKLYYSTNKKTIKKNNENKTLKSPKELSEEWGVHLGNNLTMYGNILSPPRLNCLNRNKEDIEINNIRNGTFRLDCPIKKIDITNIFYIYDRDDENIRNKINIRNEFNKLCQKFFQKGFNKIDSENVKGYSLNNTYNWENIKRQLAKLELHNEKKEKEKLFGIIFCSNNLENHYRELKDYFIRNLNIPTQHLLTKNIFSKNVDSIYFSLVEQINAKKGGMNFYIDFKKEQIIRQNNDNKFLIIGLDSKNNKNQITYSMTSSYHPKLNLFYTQEKTVNKVKEEKAKTLKDMFIKALKKLDKIIPDYIIVYRQGGNEYHNKSLAVDELDVFKDVLKDKNNQNKEEYKNTKFYYICCNLKTDLKFFEEKENFEDNSKYKYANPLSGLIIDQYVTNKSKFEFYLQPQFVNQGTATPSHYQVMYYDEKNNNLEMEKLQKLTYFLTYYYWTWHGAIRIPAILKFSSTALDFYLKCFNSNEKVTNYDFENPYYI